MKTRQKIVIHSDEQQAAIDDLAPYRLLVAGAGSGKTTTLVARILADIDAGVNPKKAVAITFTNAAADELKARIDTKLQFIGTLHSFCLSLVNHWGTSLGYSPGRVVMIDEKTEEKLIEESIAHIGTNKTQTPISKVRAMKGSGSIAKREAIVARHYCSRLRAANAVDFDTVLIDALALINTGKIPDLSALYVDEYQDSGPWDSMIYLALSSPLKMFVGDPDQCVYEWRGARLENILEVAKRPDWKTTYLLDNYRSRPEIVEAANQLIAYNDARLPKEMRPMRLEGTSPCIDYWDQRTPQAEAGIISEAIARAIDAGEKPASFAVLVRYNAQLAAIAQALEGDEIPYRMNEEKKHPWLSLAVSALNTLIDPDNEVTSAVWTDTYPDITPRLGQSKARAIIEHLRIDGEPLGKQVNAMGLPPEALHSIRACWGDGIIPEILPRLLEMEKGTTTKGEGVFVSTIHGSKGMEFDTVILAGMTANTMPGAKTGRELEAERRLFYVGVTRAKETLIVSHTMKAAKPYGPGLVDAKPSPFIAELVEA